MGDVPYSVYLRKKRANVLHSQRLSLSLSVILSKVKRTRKVESPEEEFFYRFEDMPQPKYGIKKSQLDEITCNIVKFQMEEEEHSVKRSRLAAVLNELKDIFEMGD